MNIGQLSRRTGVPIDTVRYYEKLALLPPPARSTSGYRHYEADDVLRLNFIRRAKVLGFTAQVDIREGIRRTVLWTRENRDLIHRNITKHAKQMSQAGA